MKTNPPKTAKPAVPEFMEPGHLDQGVGQVEQLRRDTADEGAATTDEEPPRASPFKPIEQEQLPVREIFDFINVGPTTGYGLIKSGKLRTFLIGRRRYGRISDAREYIKSLLNE
jgi:hypothetical protein